MIMKWNGDSYRDQSVSCTWQKRVGRFDFRGGWTLGLSYSSWVRFSQIRRSGLVCLSAKSSCLGALHSSIANVDKLFVKNSCNGELHGTPPHCDLH